MGLPKETLDELWAESLRFGHERHEAIKLSRQQERESRLSQRQNANPNTNCDWKIPNQVSVTNTQTVSKGSGKTESKTMGEERKESRYSINANPLDIPMKYYDGSGEIKVTEYEDRETGKKVDGCGYSRAEADRNAEEHWRDYQKEKSRK